MKTNLKGLFIAGAVIIFASACSKENVDPSLDGAKRPTGDGTITLNDAHVTGNGSLSGSHYQLNIIGVPKGKTANMTTGGRIFVPLAGKCNINLSPGPFEVIDANGTDGTAAFQLPNPDPENDGQTEYTVFARPLGTPGGSSTTSTCATDPLTGLVVCSDISYVAFRPKGKTSFTNVSNELLYLYADLDGDGVSERYPLFDERLQDYFWEYDNAGLKLLQLRFYPVSTNVN